MGPQAHSLMTEYEKTDTYRFIRDSWMDLYQRDHTWKLDEFLWVDSDANRQAWSFRLNLHLLQNCLDIVLLFPNPD